MEENLRPPYESYIQPESRPIDRFAFIREPRFQPHIFDFSALSSSLTRGLALLKRNQEREAAKETDLGAEDFRRRVAKADADEGAAAGYEVPPAPLDGDYTPPVATPGADIQYETICTGSGASRVCRRVPVETPQERFQAAEQGTRQLAGSLAKAVSEGTLDEAHNPYFITGSHKAAAREFASRWYQESQQAISANAARAATLDPKTGVPVAVPGGDQISSQIYNRMLGELKQVNPALAQDPWFLGELGREQERHVRGLQAQDANERGNALKTTHKNQLAVETGRMLDARFKKATITDQDYRAIEGYLSANVHLAGVKDPSTFLWGVIEAGYYRTLNDRGAAAASDFLHRAGAIRVGTAKVSEGQYAEQFEKLRYTSSRAQDDDAPKKAASSAARRAAFQDQFESGQLYRGIWEKAKTRDEVLSEIARIEPMIGKDPSLGVDPEFAREAVNSLFALADQKEKLTIPVRQAQVSEFNRLIDEGEFAQAEMVANGMAPEERSGARKNLREAKAHLEKWMDGNDTFTTGLRVARSAAQKVRPINDEFDTDFVEDISNMEAQFRQAYRRALTKVPAEEQEAFVSTGEGAKMMREYQDRVKEVAKGAKVLRDELYNPIRVAHEGLQDAEPIIRQYLKSGEINETTAEEWLKENKYETALRRNLTSENYREWRQLSARMQAAVEDTSTEVFKKFEALKWAIQRSEPTGFASQPSVVRSRITPEGAQALTKISKQAMVAFDKWMVSPEGGVAAKKAGGEFGLERAALGEMDRLRDITFKHLSGPHPEAPIDFDGTAPAAPAKPAAPKPKAEGAAESRPPAPEVTNAWTQTAVKLEQYPWQKVNLTNPYDGTPVESRLSGSLFLSKAQRLFGDSGSNKLAAMFAGPALSVASANVVTRGLEAVMPPTSLIDRFSFGGAEGTPAGKPVLYHPYPMSLMTLKAFAQKDPEAPQILQGARNQIRSLLGRVAETSEPHDQKSEAAINATRLLGLSYKEVLSGQVKTSSHSIMITDPSKIRWQVTPLFDNTAQLETFAKDEAQVEALFKALKIDDQNDITRRGEVLHQFIMLQRAAINRTQ